MGDGPRAGPRPARSLRGPPAMKVIFLDVDGVLHPLTGSDLFVDPCMRELKRIVDASGAACCPPHPVAQLAMVVQW